jgi:hypothetical protein
MLPKKPQVPLFRLRQSDLGRFSSIIKLVVGFQADAAMVRLKYQWYLPST